MYIREKEEISMANISKTSQLKPEQSRLKNSSTGKRKNTYFIFRGKMSFNIFYSSKILVFMLSLRRPDQSGMSAEAQIN